jgi:hypothetical protein
MDERLKERNAEDRGQAWSLILLGIPFALGAWLGLSWGLTMLLWFSGVAGLGASFAVSGAVVAAAMAVDTWRHPSEYWHRANYFVLGDPTLVAADGLFAGMPLMASVSDPGNLAERGRELSSGCANVALAGPRNVRRGVELLRLIRARAASEPSARLFLDWLRERAPAKEADVAEAFAKTPPLYRGFLLAREVGLVAIRSTPEGRLLLPK